MQTSTPSQSDLSRIKTEVTKLGTPILARVRGIEITNADDYLKADQLFSRISAIRKELKARVAEILKPLDEAKKNIETSRTQLKGFRDEIDHPYEVAETTLKGLMGDYKDDERRQIEAAERKKAEDKRALEAKAEEARRKSEAAPTPKMQEKLEAVAQQLEEKAEDLSYALPQTAVRAANTIVRVVKKASVGNRKQFLMAVLSGKVPEDIINWDQVNSNLEQYRRVAEEQVTAWPGVVVEEGTIIARKGVR